MKTFLLFMQGSSQVLRAVDSTAAAVARRLTIAVICLIAGFSSASAQGAWTKFLSSNDAPRATSETGCRADRAAFAKQWSAHNSQLSRYWTQVKLKRKSRRAKRAKKAALAATDYVTAHPPVYKGSKYPKCKLASDVKKRAPKTPAKPAEPLPTVVNFLAATKKHYGFEPRATSERDYKAGYARAALAEGLSAGQVVGVYALETGGIGPYARQSGIFITDQNCKPRKAFGRAASTALGYAQLLAANSVAVVKLQGELIAAKLAHKARQVSGGQAIELQLKSQMILQMRRDVISGTRRYKRKNNWREYVYFGKTERGQAMHALNLDADIGPILQVYKLLRIKIAAAKKGFHRVSGAEMELMNLVGFGRGLEMMQPVAGTAASANFFSRKAYGRNPLAKNLTARGLLAKIDRIIAMRMKKCGSKEFMQVFRQVARHTSLQN